MKSNATVNRRSFLRRASAVGTSGLIAGTLASLSGSTIAQAQTTDDFPVTDGDIAILKFLAAAELVEDDLWQQYAELAVGNKKFAAALRRIDPSLIRYIQDDRDDERSHAALINSFLASIGEQPVNLDPFRTLPSVQVQGADQSRGRLTNLTKLTVDTSWYLRYRSADNPDFGATFPQLVNIVDHPTVPTQSNHSLLDLQAIAHSAAFHFAAIEQGGSSLYASLITKATNLDVLAILGSIGPTEVYHFSAFHKSLENIFTVRTNRVRFPNLRANPDLAFAIFPEPCELFDISFPLVSIIRPSSTEKAGAVAAATGLVNSGLFGTPGQAGGQSQAFFDAVVALATAADAAQRG